LGKCYSKTGKPVSETPTHIIIHLVKRILNQTSKTKKRERRMKKENKHQ
jgi:hypothetical protein